MSKLPYLLAALIFSAFANTANAACPTFTNLTNGSPADASKVMDNYNYILTCPGFLGNVGIGTPTPLALLDLTGASGSAVAIRFTDTTGNTNSRNWLVGNASGPNYGDLAFQVSSTIGGSPSGTPVLNLGRTGNVGINTANAAEALEVNGRIKVDSLASASGTSLCITSTTNGVLATCSSSIRYKENIQNAGFGLREVLAMRPVTFKWKGRNERDFGLVAEEIAKINPQFATYKNQQIEGVKYPQLTAVLINAVKKLSADHDEDAAQLRAQSKEIKDLRRAVAALARQRTVQAAQNKTARLNRSMHSGDDLAQK